MNITANPAHAMPSSAAAPAPAARPAAADVTAPAVDALTQKPMPPRFPWLNWQSREVALSEVAARTPFPDAPVIGDHLDTTA